MTIAARSIDVAADYGARVVVLHLGLAGISSQTAHQIKSLFLSGQIAGAEADLVRTHYASERACEHAERMQALERSLDELIPVGLKRGVCLGLENRPICEVPNWTEMQEILTRYPDKGIGYWHDTGHAETPALLGMTPHAAWLQAYRSRLVGLHLHDVIGLESHYAPGTGVVDWAGLARLVPADTLRIIEVEGSVSPESLGDGVKRLQSSGWI